VKQRKASLREIRGNCLEGPSIVPNQPKRTENKKGIELCMIATEVIGPGNIYG
jgi:hypothetical protein